MTQLESGVNPTSKTQRQELELPPMRGVTELAHALGISPSGLRKLMKRGEAPPHIFIGNRAFFPEPETAEWFAAKRRA
jgi:predicted DNA-binding transcriptional regulator AlpA